MSINTYNTNALIYNDHGSGTNRITVKHLLPRVWWVGTDAIQAIHSGVTDVSKFTVLITLRDGYKTPQEWQALTTAEVLSGDYYTLQDGDRMIQGEYPDAPDTFQSTQAVDQHFKTASRPIMSGTDPMRLPGGKIHHWNIGLK